MSAPNHTPNEVPERNQFNASFEVAEDAIDYAQDEAIRPGEDELVEDYGDEVRAVSRTLEELENTVDDAQDSKDYAALADAGSNIREAQDQIEALQDEVGFENPSQAEAVENIEQAVEEIENAHTGVLTGYVIVADNISLVYQKSEVKAKQIMIDSGTAENKTDQKRLAALDSPGDNAEKVTEFNDNQNVDLRDDDRRYFEVRSKGSGRS